MTVEIVGLEGGTLHLAWKVSVASRNLEAALTSLETNIEIEEYDQI